MYIQDSRKRLTVEYPVMCHVQNHTLLSSQVVCIYKMASLINSAWENCQSQNDP